MKNFNNDDFRTLFQSKFNLRQWQDVLANVFKAKVLREKPELLSEYSDDGEKAFYLGKQGRGNNYETGFFYFKISDGRVRNRKVALRRLVKTFVNPNYGEFEAVVAVFDDGANWRVSFISDIKGEKTSPKRYTFVFGDKSQLYNTAIDRFLKLLQSENASYGDIKEAFSVEALTKQFYTELFQWYEWAKVVAKFPVGDTTKKKDGSLNVKLTEKGNEKNLIRLITRLIFIWFIKQKELIPDWIFDKEKIKGILRSFSAESDKEGELLQCGNPKPIFRHPQQKN